LWLTSANSDTIETQSANAADLSDLFVPGAISGVPEPSTWAMVLIGFCGLGFAFRQSRRKASFA
jgi:hypothetical protein